MLTVLWILTVGSSIALAAVLRGRAGADASRNRMAIELAAWSAPGCAASVLGALDGRFRDARSSAEREVAWLQLDRIAAGGDDRSLECGVPSSRWVSGCR
jgi:hypothetical protein